MARVIEIDAATGKVYERDFTADELTQRKADQREAAAAAQAEADSRAARIAARAAAIARFKNLGFTDEEISALVLP